MQSLSYDIWGALVVIPVLALISIAADQPGVHRRPRPLRPWVWAGLAVKFAGAVAGYNIRFDAYGGSADAGRYHAAGKLIAGEFHDGRHRRFGLIPTRHQHRSSSRTSPASSTPSSGTSRLGGFMVFTWMSFWGLAFCVKAAHHAIGGFATRRYAIAVFFFPSLVYWGSSIGKEAFVGLCLGLAAYGASLVLTRRGGVRCGVRAAPRRARRRRLRAAPLRRHLGRRHPDRPRRPGRARHDAPLRPRHRHARRSQVGTILLLAVAGIGFVIVATGHAQLPRPRRRRRRQTADGGVTDRLSTIFDKVEDRTTQGGSSFDPISVDGPQDWPLAAFRTLTRPLLFEARGLATALPPSR